MTTVNEYYLRGYIDITPYITIMELSADTDEFGMHVVVEKNRVLLPVYVKSGSQLVEDEEDVWS